MGKPAVSAVQLVGVATGFTVGKPAIAPPVTAIATALPVANTAPTARPVLCGCDNQSGSVNVASAGPGVTTPFSFPIALPNLPTPFTPGAKDTALFLAFLASITLPRGAALTSIELSPQAFTTRATPPVVGSSLRPGSTYTGWQVLVSGEMVSISATLAGAVSARVVPPHGCRRMMGSQLGVQPAPQTGSGMALPDIQTILQMLLGQLPGTPGTDAEHGTWSQQQAGSYGQLGGPAGSLYGMYGSLYGGRVPQPSIAQEGAPSPFTFGSLLGGA